ncbi:MAG: CoA transferase [Pseudomonadales bacterium]|jgi:formyl-CoA transferase|nr:CoA transferase [Pseudomonadales bacterium]MDP6471190.1 CoA transferase [Pseudomonadales bacterium]MDP6825623.1 CoA transferase [Pseudomonadales bacterium]MDP6970462.1 CoA transferase [Pseudomonadales bacterium]|tara:strand:- start:1171 stop:2376 length:1206 start_codon:yes stop_codon:yes gene_type:complete
MAALDGLRILDMTQYEAGTACTQALAWLGADVVKVEPPGTGDPGRGVYDAETPDSEYFCVWNANKRSIVIDLRKAEGRELLLRMLPGYDVFIENYGPGVVEKLELDYDTMKAIKPDLIYARIKGFGTTGPWADYKCYDMVAQAAAGAFSITGNSDGPPMRPGPTTGDAGTGVQMALAIAAAYVQKLKTGSGQLIELSMQEAMTYYLRTATSQSDWGEKVAERTGNGILPTMSLYPCKPGGANDYLFIMAVTPPMWEALANAIGRSELIEDPRFLKSRDRLTNREALTEIISAWTLVRDKYEAMRELAEGGVPASAVLDTRDLFHNAHMNERGFVQTVEHEVHGKVKVLGWPARMSESEVPIVAAPRLGRHSREIVAQDLGLDAAEIDSLIQQGIIDEAESL